MYSLFSKSLIGIVVLFALSGLSAIDAQDLTPKIAELTKDGINRWCITISRDGSTVAWRENARIKGVDGEYQIIKISATDGSWTKEPLRQTFCFRYNAKNHPSDMTIIQGPRYSTTDEAYSIFQNGDRLKLSDDGSKLVVAMREEVGGKSVNFGFGICDIKSGQWKFVPHNIPPEMRVKDRDPENFDVQDFTISNDASIAVFPISATGATGPFAHSQALMAEDLKTGQAKRLTGFLSINPDTREVLVDRSATVSYENYDAPWIDCNGQCVAFSGKIPRATDRAFYLIKLSDGSGKLLEKQKTDSMIRLLNGGQVVAFPGFASPTQDPCFWFYSTDGKNQPVSVVRRGSELPFWDGQPGVLFHPMDWGREIGVLRSLEKPTWIYRDEQGKRPPRGWAAGNWPQVWSWNVSDTGNAVVRFSEEDKSFPELVFINWNNKCGDASKPNSSSPTENKTSSSTIPIQTPNQLDASPTTTSEAEKHWQSANDLAEKASDKDPKMFEQAIVEAEKAVNLASGSLKYNRTLAILLTRIDNPYTQLMAENILQNVVEVNPKDAEARLSLGSLLARKNFFDSAIREFKEAIKLNPDLLNPRLVSTIATCFVLDSQATAGVQYFKELVKTNPKLDCAKLALAIILKHTKKDQEASSILGEMVKEPDVSAENREAATKFMAQWASK
ncbi:MAG: hypothetical protein HQM08_19065 [Candidatus Riflebacteria bacterium]|nr:hypothetical protein [Candidatus Riflebacteria bacterium]